MPQASAVAGPGAPSLAGPREPFATSDNEDVASVTSLDTNPSVVFSVLDATEHVRRFQAASGRAPIARHSSRADVGFFAVLCGNWGGTRALRERATQIQVDLKRTPAAIIVLQEAHHGLKRHLEAAPPPRGASARGSGLGARPDSAFKVVMGNEACNTLLEAARDSIASDVEKLAFYRSEDGNFRSRSCNGAGENRSTAMYRLMVCRVTFRHPQQGMDELMVCAMHFHYMSANLKPGGGG